VNGCGFAVAASIINYYVQTWWGLRKKTPPRHGLFLRVQEAAKTNWMNEKLPVPL
jgi:hypothetical protein